MAAKFTPQDMRYAALDAIELLEAENMWTDCDSFIYVNNERWSAQIYSHTAPDKIETRTSVTGITYYVEKDIDVTKYCSYVNPKTLTIVSYPLGEAVEYSSREDYYFESLNELVEGYDLYFEQADSTTFYATSAYSDDEEDEDEDE